MDIGADKCPVGPAGLTLLYDVVGDFRATICKWGLPSQLNAIGKDLSSFY